MGKYVYVSIQNNISSITTNTGRTTDLTKQELGVLQEAYDIFMSGDTGENKYQRILALKTPSCNKITRDLDLILLHLIQSHREIRVQEEFWDEYGERLDITKYFPEEYTNIRYLDEGGKGWVYIASYHDRDVCIKVLPPFAKMEKEDQQRFAQETEIMMNLRHIHIVSGIATGKLNIVNLPFYTMEYCANGSLEKRLALGKKIDDCEAAWEAISIIEKIAEALDYFYKTTGMIHRDLKPQNILFDDNNNPKLADFGYVKNNNLVITQDGVVVGTPNYQAPEQLMNDNVDCRTDIFTLGIILIEMISGEKMGDKSQNLSQKRTFLRQHLKPYPAIHNLCYRMLMPFSIRISSYEELLSQLRNLHNTSKYQNIQIKYYYLKEIVYQQMDRRTIRYRREIQDHIQAICDCIRNKIPENDVLHEINRRKMHLKSPVIFANELESFLKRMDFTEIQALANIFANLEHEKWVKIILENLNNEEKSAVFFICVSSKNSAQIQKEIMDKCKRYIQTIPKIFSNIDDISKRLCVDIIKKDIITDDRNEPITVYELEKIAGLLNSNVGTILVYGKFRKLNLENANLENTKLENVNFQGTNLNNARLDGSNVTAQQLRKAKSIFGISLGRVDFYGQDLRYVDFAMANFENANLAMTDLKGSNFAMANFVMANLKDANLKDANLKGANLENTKLENVNFQGTNLNNARLDGSNVTAQQLRKAKSIFGISLGRVDFYGQDLRYVDFAMANFENANLAMTDLKGSNFAMANFVMANLKDANLKDANLKGANLKDANLKDANLKGANLKEANMEGANFEKANFQETNLDWTRLDGSNVTAQQLRKAKSIFEISLKKVDFSHQDLSNIGIEGANLEGANLEGANLEGANLEGANLEGANLEGANLEGANLKYTNLKYANFTNANLNKVQADNSNIKTKQLKTSKSSIKISLKGIDFSYQNLSLFDLANANLANANLKHANLTNANLKRANLENSDLQGANFENSCLMGSNLENANLSGSNLKNANLITSNLKNTNLQNACIEGVTADNSNITPQQLRESKSFMGISLKKRNFSGRDLSRINLENADLTEANLEKVTLTEANLKNANLTEANLKYANLTEANLERVTLTNANLTNANLTNANLKYANLTNANLTNVNLKYAYFKYADLTEANLEKVTLTNANLTNANLANVKITLVQFRQTHITKKVSYANLSTADLEKANLTNANLTNANLTNANLKYANLTNANLTNANLTNAIFDSDFDKKFFEM